MWGYSAHNIFLQMHGHLRQGSRGDRGRTCISENNQLINWSPIANSKASSSSSSSSYPVVDQKSSTSQPSSTKAWTAMVHAPGTCRVRPAHNTITYHFLPFRTIAYLYYVIQFHTITICYANLSAKMCQGLQTLCTAQEGR